MTIKFIAKTLMTWIVLTAIAAVIVYTLQTDSVILSVIVGAVAGNLPVYVAIKYYL